VADCPRTGSLRRAGDYGRLWIVCRLDPNQGLPFCVAANANGLPYCRPLSPLLDKALGLVNWLCTKHKTKVLKHARLLTSTPLFLLAGANNLLWVCYVVYPQTQKGGCLWLHLLSHQSPAGKGGVFRKADVLVHARTTEACLLQTYFTFPFDVGRACGYGGVVHCVLDASLLSATFRLSLTCGSAPVTTSTRRVDCVQPQGAKRRHSPLSCEAY